MKEKPAAPCLISLSRQGQDFLSGSAVHPATEDSPIQAHNVPVSPDNTSCLCWLQPSQGYTIFHSSQQWPVCLHPPYGYYGPQYWHTSLIIQRAEREREPLKRNLPVCFLCIIIIQEQNHVTALHYRHFKLVDFEYALNYLYITWTKSNISHIFNLKLA